MDSQGDNPSFSVKVSIGNHSENVVGRAVVIFYDVDVIVNGQLTKSLKKRYNDFDSLRQSIHANKAIHVPISYRFPPKTVLYSPSKDHVVVLNRRAAFETFLNFLLELSPIPPDVMLFLQLADEDPFLAKHKTDRHSFGHRTHRHSANHADHSHRLLNSNSAYATPPNKSSKSAAIDTTVGSGASDYVDIESPDASLSPLTNPDAISSKDVDTHAHHHNHTQRTSIVGNLLNPFGLTGKGNSKSTRKVTLASDDTANHDKARVTYSPFQCLWISLLCAAVTASLAILYYSIRCIVTKPFSLGGIVRYVASSIFSAIMTFRFTIEVIIALITFQLVFHRLLGYALGTYLTKLLGTPEGAFQFSFNWIAIRPGFDHNEIVINRFIWKNPPRFKETEYFVMVKQLTIRFDMMTVIKAIRFNEDIVLHYVEIDSIDVFIEKGKRSEGLNLWAALGADNEEDEKSVESSVMSSIAKAVRATASATSDALDLVAKYNPASALYRTIKSTSGKLKKKGDRKDSSSKKDSSDRDSLTRPPDDHDHEYGSDDDHEHHHEHDDLQGRDSIFDDSSPRPHNEDDDDLALSNRASIGGNPTTTNDRAEPESGGGHWGVQYKLKAELFTLRSLHVFAEDFLNAKHTNSAKSLSHALKVELMNMTEKELTDKPKKGTKQRRGLYLDDLVWRLIARLISELLASNKVALSTILASAAANQTSAAVVGTVTSVARGAVQEIYTFNPKTLLQGASYLSNAAIHALDAKQEHEVTEAIKSRGFTCLEVHLKAARGLTVGGSKVSTCFCLISLTNQEYKMERTKSSVQSLHSTGEFTWDERIVLQPLLTFGAVLNIKIMVPNILTKDTFVAQFLVPLDSGSKFEESSHVDAHHGDGNHKAAATSGKGTGVDHTVESPSRLSSHAVSGKASSGKHGSHEIDSFKSSKADLSLLVGLEKEVVRWHTGTGDSSNNAVKPELLLGLMIR